MVNQSKATQSAWQHSDVKVELRLRTLTLSFLRGKHLQF